MEDEGFSWSEFIFYFGSNIGSQFLSRWVKRIDRTSDLFHINSRCNQSSCNHLHGSAWRKRALPACKVPYKFAVYIGSNSGWDGGINCRIRLLRMSVRLILRKLSYKYNSLSECGKEIFIKNYTRNWLACGKLSVYPPCSLSVDRELQINTWNL